MFGNAGGGKSALAQRLAELTGLPLYVVDMMQFRPGGAKVPYGEFLLAHADLLRRDEWIIDGFGDCLGAVRRGRYTDLCRSISIHSLPMDNQALNQRPVRRSARLAGKQSPMEQLRAKLSCALALPPSPDAQVPAACCRGSRIEEGAPLEIT